jgi:hypothetical protein
MRELEVEMISRVKHLQNLLRVGGWVVHHQIDSMCQW